MTCHGCESEAVVIHNQALGLLGEIPIHSNVNKPLGSQLQVFRMLFNSQSYASSFQYSVRPSIEETSLQAGPHSTDYCFRRSASFDFKYDL